MGDDGVQGERGERGEPGEACAKLWPEEDIVSPPEKPPMSIAELRLVMERLRCVLVEP